LYPGEVQLPGSFTNKRASVHDSELAKGSDNYEAQLCNGYSKSIPYFEEKHNPVKHMMAMCSIWWCQRLYSYGFLFHLNAKLFPQFLLAQVGDNDRTRPLLFDHPASKEKRMFSQEKRVTAWNYSPY